MQNSTSKAASQRNAIALLIKDARATQNATARTQDATQRATVALDLAVSALCAKDIHSARGHISAAKQSLSVVKHDVEKDAKDNAESVKNLEAIFATL
jgi:D-arabinose 1-dehydrogenase-like Zn-dependent alcohol dehydrogenase